MVISLSLQLSFSTLLNSVYCKLTVEGIDFPLFQEGWGEGGRIMEPVLVYFSCYGSIVSRLRFVGGGGIRVWGRQFQNLNQPTSSFCYLQFPIYRRYKTENDFRPPSCLPPPREGRWEFRQMKTDRNTNCTLQDFRYSQLDFFSASRTHKIQTTFKFTKCKKRSLCTDEPFLCPPTSFCFFSFVFFLSMSLFYFPFLSVFLSCSVYPMYFYLCSYNHSFFVYYDQINKFIRHYIPCYFIYKIIVIHCLINVFSCTSCFHSYLFSNNIYLRVYWLAFPFEDAFCNVSIACEILHFLQHRTYSLSRISRLNPVTLHSKLSILIPHSEMKAPSPFTYF